MIITSLFDIYGIETRIAGRILQNTTEVEKAEEKLGEQLSVRIYSRTIE